MFSIKQDISTNKYYKEIEIYCFRRKQYKKNYINSTIHIERISMF